METELLIQHLCELKNGNAIYSPTYDYSVHNRSKTTIKIEPRPIIIIEGILVLQEPKLVDLMDIKIYVEADADERILRRIIRDVNERGRSVESVVQQYLTTVKPMHYLFVEPTKVKADIIINSGMNEIALEIIRAKIDALLNEF